MLCRAWTLTGSAAASTSIPSGRLLFIDGLRGLAASGVALFHFNYVPSLTELPPLLHGICEKGHLGVPVFFVLSGFVISHTLRHARINPSYIGRFALRRSLRLDPTYWTIILLTLFLSYVGVSSQQKNHTIWTILANMFYLNDLVCCPQVVNVGWTLCLEIQFYLAYAILFGLTQQLARLMGETASRFLIFGPLAAYSVFIAAGSGASPLPGLFVDRWHLFFLGVMSSWIVSGKLAPRWLIACLIGIAVWFGWQRNDWSVAAAAAGMTALGIVIMGRAGRLHDALGWKWLQYLGQISYSVYLTHQLAGRIILDLAAAVAGTSLGPIGAVILLLGAFAGTVGAANLLYVLVERPSLTFSRRVAM
jgi:peptidoglycan/LPS O-acetylase OafA/YrhL